MLPAVVAAKAARAVAAVEVAEVVDLPLHRDCSLRRRLKGYHPSMMRRRNERF
jgi:hypothetical protein